MNDEALKVVALPAVATFAAIAIPDLHTLMWLVGTGAAGFLSQWVASERIERIERKKLEEARLDARLSDLRARLAEAGEKTGD